MDINSDTQRIDLKIEPRADTGPMKFKDDWTGIFIRGDEAITAAMYLEMALESIEDPDLITMAIINSHIKLLRSCDERFLNG